MAAARRRSDDSPQLLGNHNRSWIWGRNLVLSTLRSGRWQPLELLLGERCDASTAREVRQLAESAAVPIQEVSDQKLQQCCRSDDHQGLAALMPAFPYADFADLLRSAAQVHHWLVLDGVQDSFNFGAMLRSGTELGTDAVLIGQQFQSPVNSQVARSSAGGVNHLPIVRVEELATAVEQLKKRGIRVIGASEKGSAALHEVDLTGPTALVIGNEGRGLSPRIWELCDTHVRIPTSNHVGSLNAAVAAGILCYERLRQQLTIQKASE